MIYLLYGEEYFLLKNKQEEIINKLKIDNIISIDFDNSKISNIINEVQYVDLFNSKKLVIVSNFSFSKLKSEEERAIIDFIDSKSENIIILKCIDKSLDGRKNIIKRINADCEVYNAIKLDRWQLINYIKDYFKNAKLKISDDNIKRIVNICGFSNYSENNNYVFNEINKLVIYKLDSEEITSEDIDNVISRNTENELFNLINAVIKRDIKTTFEEFKIIKELNIDAFVIASAIVKQFRVLLQIKILSEEMSYDSIAKKLSMNPYAVEIIGKNKDLYTYEELADVIDKLFNMDEKMKYENIDKYKLLEQFFIDME